MIIRTTPLALVLALIATLCCFQTATADSEWQFGGQDYGSFGDFFSSPRAPISRRDLDLYAQRLDLTEDQLHFIRDRYDALITTYRQKWLDFAEQRTDARYNSQMSGDWEQMQNQQRESRLEQQQMITSLVDSFMDDLRIVLTPEQDALWTVMERDRLRRETLTKFTVFNEERFDLIECVSMLDLNEDEKAVVADTLERYAQTLHPLIQNRNRRTESLATAYERYLEFNIEYQRALREANYDVDATMQHQERQQNFNRQLVTEALSVREASARIRDINIQFRNELQRLLPDRTHEDFAKMTNPKPATTMDNWWSDYSRAGQLIGMLENLEATKTMMGAWASGMGENEEMQEWMTLMQAAEPLSTSQRRMLEDIKKRLNEQRDRVKERYAARRAANTRAVDEDNSFSVATSAATLRFYRQTAESSSPPWFNRGESDNNDQQEMAKELNKIEQDTINEIRAILSIRQRMAIANM